MFDRRKRSLSRRLLAAAKLKKPIFGAFFDKFRLLLEGGVKTIKISTKARNLRRTLVVNFVKHNTNMRTQYLTIVKKPSPLLVRKLKGCEMRI